MSCSSCYCGSCRDHPSRGPCSDSVGSLRRTCYLGGVEIVRRFGCRVSCHKCSIYTDLRGESTSFSWVGNYSHHPINGYPGSRRHYVFQNSFGFGGGYPRMSGLPREVTSIDHGFTRACHMSYLATRTRKTCRCVSPWGVYKLCTRPTVYRYTGTPYCSSFLFDLSIRSCCLTGGYYYR